MNFDYQFTELLKVGDIASAQALLLRKYPGISKYRVSMYVHAYSRLIAAKQCLLLRSLTPDHRPPTTDHRLLTTDHQLE